MEQEWKGGPMNEALLKGEDLEYMTRGTDFLPEVMVYREYKPRTNVIEYTMYFKSSRVVGSGEAVVLRHRVDFTADHEDVIELEENAISHLAFALKSLARGQCERDWREHNA